MLNNILGSFSQFGLIFKTLFIAPEWRDWVDIALLTVLLYYFMKLLKTTRAKTVFKGVALIIIIALLCGYLELHAVSWVLELVFNVGIVALVILFQPELRGVLDKLGRLYSRNSVLKTSKKKLEADNDRLVNEITTALLDMSRTRTGALIVFERQQSLDPYAETGTSIDSEISSALIENIFVPNTPLHDGAMIIRNNRILAAACILTLSGNTEISRELGTRHRAGIGVTETTDCVTFIVSEETGVISMAKEGLLSRHLDKNSLTILVKDLFTSENRTPSIFERITAH